MTQQSLLCACQMRKLIIFIWGIDGSVWMQHECIYFTVPPPQGPGQVLCPWLCLALHVEIEAGISKCFLYPRQIALMTFLFFFFFLHVFSLPACRVVRWSSLNMAVLERNPWPLTSLQSLQHVRAKSRVFPQSHPSHSDLKLAGRKRDREQ